MKRLTALVARIGTFLDVLSGAYGATASVRMHERPSKADLRRLGIKPKDFTVRL
jgi:hypothetical protein